MTVATPHMKRLYSKLQTVGYNPKYIKSLLPDWWDDEIAEPPRRITTSQPNIRANVWHSRQKLVDRKRGTRFKFTARHSL